MARKHNTRHDRSPSQYPARLRDRGTSSSAVRMPFIQNIGTPKEPRLIKHDTPAFIHGRR